jgi:hypothetical protein
VLQSGRPGLPGLTLGRVHSYGWVRHRVRLRRWQWPAESRLAWRWTSGGERKRSRWAGTTCAQDDKMSRAEWAGGAGSVVRLGFGLEAD